ncbi:MAG: TetR/AcrR family transcriptional regulator [Actinobacteria bacterium]|nr:TetR/AcrR family transcriptional regulator [Actinomycetota bacterium]
MPSLPAAPELNESRRVDGRAARGIRTRSAIADALYSILREGLDDTSARAIAERAGVSTRSVFQHFDDIEAVYAEVAARQELAIRPFLEPIDPMIPLGERIDRLVVARDEMYAIVAPVRRAANKHRSTPIEVAGDERLALRIDVCLSFETWDQFTMQHGLSRAAARGHLIDLVRSLLAR